MARCNFCADTGCSYCRPKSAENEAISEHHLPIKVKKLEAQVASLTEALDVTRETLRDQFAMNAPTDEVGEIYHRSLSVCAAEKLTGMKKPERPMEAHAATEKTVAYQLAQLKWECAVNAAIRYKLADAMLEARQK